MITHGALGLLSGGRARQHADELFAQRYTTATSLPPMLRPVLDGLLALNIDMAMDAVAIRLGTWQWGMLFVGALMTLIVLALHRTVGRFKVGPKMIKGYSDSRSATRQSLDPPVEGAARALARSWTLVSQDVRFADTAAPLNGLEVS